MVRWSSIVLAWMLLSAAAALGQPTAFSYQGQLTNESEPATGSYDFQFALFGAVSGGAQIGATQTVAAVPVSNGVFTVQLDFGVSAFPGANRLLEIGVRPASTGSYTTLAPRQQISSTPYAIRTLSAMSADALSSACVGCVTDAQIGSVAGSKVSGAIPAASVPSGSGNYIQNTTAPQPNSNFNISGNGTVGGNLTVSGTLNANVSGNFIQNRTTPQGNANFDVSGNGTVGGTLAAGALAAGPPVAMTPQLDVNGTAWFSGDSTPLTGRGKGVAIGSNGVDSGYVFAFNYGTNNANAPLNLLLNNPGGNVGVGTLAGPPAAKLEVDGNAGDAILGIATAPNKVGVHGESSSYQGVYGHSVTNAGVVAEADQFHALFAVSHSLNNAGVYATNDGGGVGAFGTCTSPLPCVGVQGSVAHSNSVGVQGVDANPSDGSSTGVQGTSMLGIGVSGFSAAPGSTTVAGVYGQSTGFNGVGVIGQADGDNAWGVYGASANRTGIGVVGNATGGGWAMAASGNTTQIRTAGGWVKAMVAVAENSTITRCYNSMLAGAAASTPPCGFTVAPRNGGAQAGDLNIDFGFTVDDRFWSVTAANDSQGYPIAAVAAGGGTVINVETYYISRGGDNFGQPTYGPFVLIVY